MWLKTSLVVQYIYLELLWNLSYEFLKKIKHNSRIIISGIYKIVINSPEGVNFGERGKSSGRHSLTSTVKPVLTVSLAKGPLRVCVVLVKGFMRVHWRGFLGDDPG
jgi:hypothetical protein